MKISFCTTCSNRTHQLRQTFERNVGAISGNVATEWVILNYNSGDDLDNFMEGALRGACDRIVYARELSGRPWHASVAKNIVHRIATGDVLMNLDCDNFIGEDTSVVIEAHFLSGGQVLHLWSGELGDGTGGRIAIGRDLFHRLGGYDERFYPMGYQDFDLLARAEASGFPVTRCAQSPDLAIRNSKEESVRYCARDGLDWAAYNRLNRARSLANTAARRLVANAPRGWAPLKVETKRGLGIGSDGRRKGESSTDPSGLASRRPSSWIRRALGVLGLDAPSRDDRGQ